MDPQNITHPFAVVARITSHSRRRSKVRGRRERCVDVVATAWLNVPAGGGSNGRIELKRLLHPLLILLMVVSAGITGKYALGWMASAQLKHFGKYPLIEDDSVASEGSTIVNLRVGREWSRYGLHLDVLNLLDSDDHDVDYFYASRLSGEPAEGVQDIHFHVFPPRSLRLSLQYRF